uniref:putative site-specific DNA endonuclease n=1 Tax=Massjukichlorella minus TaxID=2650457 RepID=UPI00241196E2|nr:putative site-specific DNA endonuclease [Massjukichlorella minus]WDY12946.1 putative site-specific DNA endonuclease [Massjukichlorella minus]
MALDLTDIEIAWMAGLLEGEGYFYIDRRNKARYKKSTSPPAPAITLSMTDKDVIEKFARLVKKKPWISNRKTVKNKTVYTVYVGDRETLIFLLPRLLPHFGERRSKIVTECIHQLTLWSE